MTGRDGFPALLRSEFTKFRTVRGWVVGVLVAVLATAGMAMLVRISCGHPGPNGEDLPCTLTAGPDGRAVTDTFYFVHRSLTGDGTITVRATSLTGRYAVDTGQVRHPGDPVELAPGLQPWSKAGVMVKDGTGAGSSYAALMVTGGQGVRMQYDYVHDEAGSTGLPTADAPRWLRLTRSGDTLTGAESTDGTHWTEVGAATLPDLPDTVQIGMFAASPQRSVILSRSIGSERGARGPSLATAAFDHVDVTGPAGTAAGDWTGTKAGVADDDVLRDAEGYRAEGGRYTVTGTGDIAPAVVGGPAVGTTVGTTLIGTVVGLIVVIVLGAAFVTAEYRLGLVRSTFAASPHRGRVLAAKAVVIGAVAFAAGLVAALVAETYGVRLLRSGGNPVFPADGLTVLRVAAGTAGLLALAAVLAMALGVVLRRGGGAIVAVVAVVVLPYLLAVTSVLPSGPADWLLRLTPAAAFAVQQTTPEYHQVLHQYTPQNGYFPLSGWAGFAVLCAWAAAALGLAATVLRRRDA